MPAFIDISGQKFGRLTVIRRAPSPHGNTKWECVCECGVTKSFIGCHLKSGKSASCGCFHKEVARDLLTKHGLSNHPLHRIWKHIIDRCENKNNKDYHSYGGRGIKMCDRWRTNFQNFYDDMLATYRPGLSIERIKVNLDYSPDNCEWIPLSEQSKNRRPSSEWKRLGKNVSNQRGVSS